MRGRTQDHTLSAVLVEFAQTMVTDYSIQDNILDGFVHPITDVLPVTGAGVTLMTADIPDYVAASDRSDCLGVR